MLKVENLNVFYGGIHALKGVSIDVREGQIVSIIGSNGAGKSTLLNTISGIVKPKEGRIEYKGKDLSRLPHRVVKAGISQVPEGRLVFANLTVKENLMMGAYLRRDTKGIEKDLKSVFRLFPRLEERIGQMAGTLSGGEQQMLAIGRALMCKPKLLMLDEPSLGLAPVIIDSIMEKITEINQHGTTILLIEQNAHLALEVSHYAYVLSVGKVVSEGQSADLAKDKAMLAAYLGGS